MRVVFGGHACAPAGRASQKPPHSPTAKTKSARRIVFIVISGGPWTARSFSRSPPIDLDRTCFDPRNELPTELDGVIEGIESANEKRVHSEHVVIEDCFGDLLGSADET
jgi:hypothetical protein